MKKGTILFLVLISSQVFSQDIKSLENRIVKQWMEYSKAFEYKDYESISNHFTYPAIFNNAIPVIVNDKKMMARAYKSVRENLQKGYKYSLLEDWKLLNISKSHIILDAYYSRFNANYEPILSGRGLYTYKKIKDKWLMSEVTTLTSKKLK